MKDAYPHRFGSRGIVLIGKIASHADSIIRPSRSRHIFKHLLTRARAARAVNHYADAALLYEEALLLQPHDHRLMIQAGHMRKEAGELASAGRHYLAALRGLPDDADLALQLGHYYKLTAEPDRAQVEYRRSVTLRPGWDVAAQELAQFEQVWRGTAPTNKAGPPCGADKIDSRLSSENWSPLDGEAAALAYASELDVLSPSLTPRHPSELFHSHDETIDVRRLGRRETGFWGNRRTLRGIEAIRGFCISEIPIVEIQVIVSGLTLHRGTVEGGYQIRMEIEPGRRRKYVFNLWLDFAGFTRGLHTIELRLLRADSETRSFHDEVVVADEIPESAYPGSDALVCIDRNNPLGVEEQIRTRPSMVRSAQRTLLPDGVRNVLLMRTDQLGDMVASIPAVLRLREALPDANFVVLATAANAGLARMTALFDEIIVIDFPDDPIERRRIMPLHKQEELRRRLAPYQFDIAIDLALVSISRDLLHLADAKFTYGGSGEDWPWISAEFNLNTHDPWNGLETIPHSAKILAHVETFCAMLGTRAPILQRTDIPAEVLSAYGLGIDERFALLHMGARITFSRWPYYPELAVRLLKETDLKVVMMTDDPATRAALPQDLLPSDRFIFIDKRLDFDIFDAFISNATVMVGNDSGPKHLAALRGTNVVTLFTARINWSEWGQENIGSIISRRVPCAGCSIFHDPEECGKGFSCIRDIRIDEVFKAVMRYV